MTQTQQPDETKELESPVGMDAFFTREKAEQGKKVPLAMPDGTISDHWIMIRSIDSDIFRKAESVEKRRALEISMIEDDKERDEAIFDSMLTTLASLIISWSFEDEKCDLETKKRFLREAPQVRDSINQLSAKRSFFYQGKSESSLNGHKKK